MSSTGTRQIKFILWERTGLYKHIYICQMQMQDIIRPLLTVDSASVKKGLTERYKVSSSNSN